MKILSWLLTFIGVASHIIVPAKVIPIENKIIWGFPSEILLFYIGLCIMLVGLVMVYIFWFKGYADQLDQGEQA